MKTIQIEIPDNYSLEKTDTGYKLVEIEQKPDLSIINDIDWFYIEWERFSENTRKKWFSKGNIISQNIEKACHIDASFSDMSTPAYTKYALTRPELIKYIRLCTQEEIDLIYAKFPQIKPKIKRKWEDYGEIKKGYFISHASSVIELQNNNSSYRNKSTFPTESLAKEMLAFCQVQMWMVKDEFNGNWEWVEGDKFCTIKFDLIDRVLRVVCLSYSSEPLKFKSSEVAEMFLEEFGELLLECKNLI